MGKEHGAFRNAIKKKSVGAVVAAVLRTTAGFVACPGDEIVMVASSVSQVFSGADKAHHSEEPAIMPSRPTVVFLRKGEREPQI